MKGWPVAEVETEKRRFAMLKHLRDTPGRELSDEVLMMGARANGIPSTRDQVRTAMNWLAEQDLVKLNTIGSMVVAKLTEAGSDVVSGHSTPPGILPFGAGV